MKTLVLQMSLLGPQILYSLKSQMEKRRENENLISDF